MKHAKKLFKLSCFFLILIISLSNLTKAQVSDSFDLPTASDDPFSESIEQELPQSEDLVIKPSLTKRLLVQLQGKIEQISFELLYVGPGSFVYKVSIIVNGNIQTSKFVEFLQPENLVVELESNKKECLIYGDKGFSVKIPLNEEDYYLTISQEITDSKKDNLLTSHKRSEGSNMITVISTIGSSCVIMVLLYTIKSAFSRRLRKINETLPAKSTEDKLLLANKGSINEDFTASSLSSSESYKFSQQKRHKQEELKLTEAETSAEPSNEDLKSCQVILNEENTVKPPNNERKRYSRRESKIDHHAEIAFNFEEERQDEKNVPIFSEIKALVKQMEEEGTIGYDNDPSEVTDEDDQYEAPVLPNYFCCMLCFEGTRCTIVEPCRHIFACRDCISELLNTGINCILCGNIITSYEPL